MNGRWKNPPQEERGITMTKSQTLETQTEIRTPRQAQLFMFLWPPLKSWIPMEGWKGYPYSGNDDIIPALSKASGAIFRKEIAEVLVWLRKKKYIEILRLEIGYIQVFAKFPDTIDLEYKRIFMPRKLQDKHESP